MTVSRVNLAAAGSGTTSAAAAVPASPVAGNVFVACVGNKPFSSVPTGPAGYSQLATGTSGSVANGISTGSVCATAFSYDVVGGESGTATFSVASGSPTIARIAQYAKSAGNIWALAATVLADTDETVTSVSATGSAIPIAAGDELLLCVVIKDDAPTHTSQALSVPGCTLGAVTWQIPDTTISGNDGAVYVGQVTVTAGSSSGAPTYTATSSVSGASATAVSVVRLRDVTPPPAGFVPAAFRRRVAPGYRRRPSRPLWTPPAAAGGGPGLIVPRTAPAAAEVASGTSVTGNLSADLVSGDHVVAVFGMSATVAEFTAPPSPWTAIIAPNVVATNRLLAVYIAKDPPSGPAGGQSVAGRATCVTQGYGGVDPTTPVDVTGTPVNASATPLVVTGVTVATAGARLLGAVVADTGSATFGTPVEMGVVRSYSASSVGRATTLADEVRAATGATGTRTWTLSLGALAMRGVLFALRPAPGGAAAADGPHYQMSQYGSFF